LRTVLITGAGRGLGFALAEVFHRRGWRVFPLVRDPAAATRFAGWPACHPILADVAEDAAEAAIARALGEQVESLDLLINNAGIITKKPGLLEMTPSDLADHFQVHCAGAFRCCRAAFPFLAKAGAPFIVNVTSRRGTMAFATGTPIPRGYAYAVAKCAQNMLTVLLDREFRPHGVRVFAVHPGRLLTDAAPPDADTTPGEAAERLAGWIESAPRDRECGCLDLMSGTFMPW